MDCQCNYCKNDVAFPIPPELVERLISGNVVLFAGAGISTENPDHSASTFYQEVRHLLSEPTTPTFPALMSQLCSRPDGRLQMISKIKDRFQYFQSFHDFYERMSRFHRAIRPLHMISDVVTTNWDDFFEKEAGFDPFIYDEDLPLIEGSSRRLIKIHGSINNVGSIVATEEDYRRSFKRLNNGPLGAYLKTLMSTKTIVYVGYSLNDDNYIRLLKNISRLLGNMARQSYIVSPKIDTKHLSKLPIKLIPIETDGSYFLEEVRKHVNSQLPIGCGMTPEKAFVDCDELLEATVPLHEDTAGFWEISRHPLSIFALSYQDGLIHSLQRFRSKRKTADYYDLHRVQHLVHLYEDKVRSYADKADHWNACYFRGYQSGLIFLLLASGGEDFSWPPPVDLGFEGAPDTLSKLKKFARRRVPQEFAEQASRMASTIEIGMIPDHTPYG